MFKIIIAVKCKAGEHDFVVILPCNAIVCIEVKRPNTDQGINIKSIKRAYHEGNKQISKLEQLLNGIDATHKFGKFVAFPSIDEKDLANIPCFSDQNTPILWKDDIQRISERLKDFIKNNDGITQWSDLSYILIGIWLNNKGLDSHYPHVLGETINLVNKKIMNQKMFFKPDNRSEELVKIPVPYKTIFKNHLKGIQFINKDQKIVLLADFPIFVNGPAGSGKTLMMSARILELLGQGIRVAVLIPWGDHAQDLKELAERLSNVPVILLFVVDKIVSQNGCPVLFNKMLEQCEQFKLVIFVRPNFLMFRGIYLKIDPQNLVKIHESFLNYLSTGKHHIFCDDFQNSISHSIFFHNDCNAEGAHPLSPSKIMPIADFLFKKYNDGSLNLWIGCDLMQTVQYRLWSNQILIMKTREMIHDIIKFNVCNKKFISLFANLRNSHDIGLLLKALRDHFLKHIENKSDVFNPFISAQEISHFICGPKPRLYILDDIFSELTSNIIKRELTVMYEALNRTPENIIRKIAVIGVYNHESYLTDCQIPGSGENKFRCFRKRVASMANSAFPDGSHDEYISFSGSPKYLNSLEFPCALLVVDMTADDESITNPSNEEAIPNILAHLYAAISRARVLCSIIFICSDKENSILCTKLHRILYPFVRTIMVKSELQE